jgi:hypothetical protein
VFCAVGASAVIRVRPIKKADVAWHLMVLDHIGVLVNGPPDNSGPPFT